MPSTSKKQHNAMAAAAYGKSSLGISSAVGKEFVKADKGKFVKVTKNKKDSGKPPAGSYNKLMNYHNMKDR